MNSFRLNVRSHPRADIPADVGPERWLADLVMRAVAAGTAGPSGVVLRERSVDIVDLGLPKVAGVRVGWLLAGLTTTTTDAGGRAEAVGVIGLHKNQRKGGVVEQAVVFLEWSDNRWWLWEAVVGSDGKTVPERPIVQAAIEGDPLPPGLGRWWSAARRSGLRVDLAPTPPPTDTTAVH